jgi:hypothetical protein
MGADRRLHRAARQHPRSFALPRALRSFRAGPRPPAGGWVGGAVASTLERFVAKPGALVVLVTLIGLSVVVATQFSFGAAVSLLRSPFSKILSRTTVAWARFKEDRRRTRMQKAVLKKHEREQQKREALAKIATSGAPIPAPKPYGAERPAPSAAAQAAAVEAGTLPPQAPPRLNPMRATGGSEDPRKGARPAPAGAARRPRPKLRPRSSSVPERGFVLPPVDLLKSLRKARRSMGRS